jgi:chemotaxis protein methyltransferase CheR
MGRSISDSTLSRLSEFLREQIGLLYPKERWGELERGVSSAAREFGFLDTEECIRWLMSAPLQRRQIETLAGFLTVGETYFYRDPKILEIAEREILPEIVRRRRGKDQRLRIWSAACSTGEEPYSLAILLHRLLPDLNEWNITILATDINRSALHKGREGVFGRWSFRNTPSWFKNLYFSAESGERFRIRESVRSMVCFEYLNLVEDSYPSLPTNTNAMDLIFCRNVLIYFDHDTAQQVVGKLNRSLVDGGWLIVGPAETLPRGYPGFQTVTFNGATCYRRAAAPVSVAAREAGGQPFPSNAALAAQAATTQAWPAAEEAPAEESQAAAPSPSEEAADVYGRGGQRQGAEGAVELYRKGEYREAAQALRELRSAGKLDREGLALLVRAEANRGMLSDALKLCQEALENDKLDPALHLLRAEILQEQGLLSEAQLALQRALYLDQNLVLAHFALGNLTLRSGKIERARKHFDNALALLEDLAPDQVLAGSEGMTAGRLGEVIRALNDDARRAGGGSR